MITWILGICAYYLVLLVYMASRATCHWSGNSWKIDYWDNRIQAYKKRTVNVLDVLCLLSINVPLIAFFFVVFYACSSRDRIKLRKGPINDEILRDY